MLQTKLGNKSQTQTETYTITTSTPTLLNTVINVKNNGNAAINYLYVATIIYNKKITAKIFSGTLKPGESLDLNLGKYAVGTTIILAETITNKDGAKRNINVINKISIENQIPIYQNIIVSNTRLTITEKTIKIT